ncbi:hypothetical protein CPC08DRAFT_293421 [Agrocybe pediades]|nr:hypothetical protein CPC08DRAFT_293421 [Agrocybe pediades]
MANAAISRVDTGSRTALHHFLLDRRFGVGSLEILSIVMNTLSAWETSPLIKLYEATTSLIYGYAESLKVLDIAISSNVPLTLPFTGPIFDVSALPLLEELSIECWITNERVGPCPRAQSGCDGFQDTQRPFRMAEISKA